ncbi:MAG: cytochrome c3 family protein [Acidobacteriota bacterium]|jgi:hypothetical protein
MRRLTLVFGALLLSSSLPVRGQDSGDDPHGNLTLDCGECHNPERWVPVERPPTFRHDTTGFALKASHTQVSCRRCHESLVFHQVGTACADCHQDAHRGELGFRCESCHTPATWTNQREMFQVHSRTRFPLLAVHARLDCAACHAKQEPWQYAATPAECGNCHLETYLETTDPSHEEAGFSRRCEDCHRVTASTWRGARFSHPESFALVGGHARLACARCHTGRSYTGLSRVCVSCHQQDYAATTSPGHAAAGFPTTCEGCHTVQAWRPATFDHNLNRFPLTGAHTQVDCSRCHAGGRYAGTPTDCFACHQTDYDGTSNPNHRASGLPTQCETCHDTGAWRPANFNHNQTRFALTGAHRRVDCLRCHEGGRYAGTPTSCFACHQSEYAGTSNPNHRASGFPTQCEACHTTAAWRPASFDHDGRYFPIYSGEHRGKWSDCSDCHVSAGNYRAFECTRCHAHSRARMDEEHEDESGYTYRSSACYRCHRSGKADSRSGPYRLR